MKSRFGLISAVLSIALMGIAWAASPAFAANGWTAADVVDKTGNPETAGAAMADNGLGLAVWASASGIRLAKHEPNGSWGTPIQIPSRSDASDPVIAANGAGEAVIAWRQPGTGPGDPQIYAIALGTDGFLTPPVMITPEDEAMSAPEVAIDAAGGAVIVWTSTTGFGFAVRARGADKFGMPMVLTETDSEATWPAVALDEEERVQVAWTENIAGDRVVRASAGTLKLSGFAAKPILSASDEDTFEPQVALSPTGAGSIVWAGFGENGSAEIYATSRDASASAWGAAEQISAADVDALEPRLDVSDAGETLFAWAEEEGDDAAIVGAEWSAGDGYSDWFQFENGVAAASPSVAVNGAGDSLVSWREGMGGNGTVQAAVRAASAGSFTTTQVSHKGINWPPATAIEDDGNAFVTWPYRDPTLGPGGGRALVAAGYDVGAPLVTALDLPAKALVGEPVPVSVSTWNVWNLKPAVTISFGDGSSAEGSSAEHVFSTPGTHTVTAVAQNSNGLVSQPRSATIEVAALPKPPAPPAAKPETPPTAKSAKTKVTLVSPASVKIAKGSVVLELKNTGDRAVKGTLRLWTTARLNPQGTRTEVGSQPYSLGAKKTKRITVKLTDPALRLIRNKRTHRLAVKATASFTDSAGKAGKTTRKVKLLGS